MREGINKEYRPGLDNQLERSHGISFLFDSRVPENYQLPAEFNGRQFRWFDRYPDEILDVHRRLYGEYINQWFS